MTDPLTPDDDARLSSLYRETDDDVEPPGEWSSLRELIGAARESGFDEEPSPRIDALLMAAARKHAPEPKRSWWARLAAWMKPVVLHPAMAGAAALVVVAGAAGVMYRRGDGEVARPAPPPERAPVATNDHGLDGDEPTSTREQQQPPAEPVAPVTLDPTTPTAPTPSAGAKPVGPKPVPTGKQGEARDRAGAGRPAGSAAAGEELAGLAIQMTPTLDQPVSVDDSVAAAPPPPPPPPPPVPPSRTPQTGQAPTNEEASQPRAPEAIASDLPERASLLRDARAAARRGDCVSVASMSSRVRALDAAYHRDVFVRDPDIAACLTAKK